MPLGLPLTTRLLAAIETDTLVFLCGAGLSIPSPSRLLSATQVSRICYDKWRAIEVLDPGLRDRIDRLADYFHDNHLFEAFLRLVPWDDLVGTPNVGHAAIADFLIARVAHAALSANFDPLIERWAEQHKVAMRGALTGHEAVAFSPNGNPLLKFHGCLALDPANTLWTDRQLPHDPVAARTASCVQWMNLHLPGKHLVVVGFWSDWGYLNNVLTGAFQVTNASGVTVIDIATSAELEVKAPILWAQLNAASPHFAHVQMSGADALDELRTAYSRVWARRYYELGRQLVPSAVPTADTCPYDPLSADELYEVRRDAEGIPYTRAAREKSPRGEYGTAAVAVARLVDAGAALDGAWWRLGAQTIRVVNGAGRGLADVRERYKEATTTLPPDVVICAGSTNFGVPARLIASGSGSSTVRPAAGRGNWLTMEEARTVLGI